MLIKFDYRCQRCHAHKIKCSGDQPCTKCLAVGCADECAYASRDRQVKVSEKYVTSEELYSLKKQQDRRLNDKLNMNLS